MGGILYSQSRCLNWINSLRNLCRRVFPLFGTAVFVGRFLGTDGCPIISTIITLFLLLVTLILIYRMRVSKRKKSSFLLFLILFLIAVLGACFRSFCFSFLSGSFLFFFDGAYGQERSLSLPDPSSGPSGSENWEDSFGIDVLLEKWPTIMGSGSAETSGSVNQPEYGETSGSVNQPEYGRATSATHVAPRGDEAGPSNQPPQGVPYSYHPEEVIGGDSVLSIQLRLLSGKTTPSPLDIYLARITAEDLFEVKVEIIQLMADLDPTGDWLGRGARALDNPRTATGEESLKRLHSFLEALHQGGRGSDTFVKLKEKVFRY